MPAGAAVVGGAIISSRSADRASDKAAAGAERAADKIQTAGEKARVDVLDFFPLAQQDLLTGANLAGDLISRGTQEQQRLLSQGNLNAQQTVGGGFDAIRSALLGLPVNQQAFAPRGITQSQPLQVSGIGQQVGGQQISPQQVRQDTSPFNQIGAGQPVSQRFSLGEVNPLASQFLGFLDQPVQNPGTNPLSTRAFQGQRDIGMNELIRALNNPLIGA